MIGFRKACHGLLGKLQILYVATRRAREPPNTAGAFIFSGMIVNHRVTNILEAQLPTPKSLEERSV